MEKLALIELSEVGLKLTFMNVSNGKYQVFKEDFDRYPLYEEVRDSKLLSPKTISSLLSNLKIYKKLIDENGIEKVVAFTSDFLLKARNQKGFLDEVYNNTNITFVYITDEELVKNLYTSVVNSIDNSKGFIFSVGVNQLAVIKYNRRTTLGSDVLPFGVLSTLYDENGEKRTYEQMVKFALTNLKNINIDFSAEEELACVGIGNPFINLGRIAKKIERYPLNIDNNYPVTNETFKKVEKFLTDLDLEKIKKVKGIVDNNSDMLMAGIAIVSALYSFFKISEVSVSTANFGDGAVRSFIGIDALDRYSDLLANSFDSYREFMPGDTSINLRVNNMSGVLFKQLKVMHKLPRAYVKPLRVASYMFDCGKQVSFSDYEKHGFYAILNSNLAGVSQKDLLLASFTCLCQKPDNFNLSEWVKYQAILTDDDLEAVRKMGIMIKLAVLLNSSKENTVTDVVCDMLGDSVIMKTISTTDVSYEISQGMKIADEYRKLFKKNLQLI